MLNVNRKMSTEQLEQAAYDSREDYRFYIKVYRKMLKKHNTKDKIATKMLELANRSRLRYQVAEELLLNR